MKCFEIIIKYLNCCKESDSTILAIYDPKELTNLSENDETIYSKCIISNQDIGVNEPLINE